MSSQGQMQCGLSTAVMLTLKSPFKLGNQRSIHAAADNHYLFWIPRQTQQVYHTLYLMKCNYFISWHWQKKTQQKDPTISSELYTIYTNIILVLFQLSDSVTSVLASRSIKLPYGFFRNPHVPEQYFIVKTCLPCPLPLLKWDLSSSRSYIFLNNYTT